MMMLLTHSFVNAALARTARPDTALAAYALAFSVAVIVEAPMVAVRQLTIALGSTAERFRHVRLVAALTLAGCLGAALVLAYTPLGSSLLTQLLGCPPELLPETLRAFRVLMLTAVASGARSLYQGLLIRNRATLAVTWGMATRLLVMGCLAWATTSRRLLEGALVGAVIFVSGVATEAFLGVLAVSLRQPRLPSGDTEADDGYRRAVRFYRPLVIAGIAASLGKPVINAGLSRTPEAAVQLSAFAVAVALAWVLIAPCQNVHQTVMVYSSLPGSRPVLRRFALGFAVLNCLALVALTWSPAGAWLLTRLVGIPLGLVGPTLRALRVLAFLPLGLTAVDYYSGILLQQGQTRVVGAARLVNVAVLGLTILGLVLVRPQLGVTIGPLAQLAGSAAETTILAAMARTPTGLRLWGGLRRVAVRRVSLPG